MRKRNFIEVCAGLQRSHIFGGRISGVLSKKETKSVVRRSRAALFEKAERKTPYHLVVGVLRCAAKIEGLPLGRAQGTDWEERFHRRRVCQITLLNRGVR